MTELEIAFSYQQEGKLLEAIKIFEDIIKNSPDNIDALHGLGLAYAQRKEFETAIIYIKKAIALNPEIPAFHNNLANALKQMGLSTQALIHYREALRLKTPYPEVYNNLGTLLFKLGMIQEAAEILEKAVRYSPESANSHYNLANCYTKLDRFQDALTHYQETLKIHPDHINAQHNIGMILVALKHYEQAKPYLNQALSDDPNNTDILFHLALVYASEGNFDNAKGLYKKLLELNPTHANAHHNLATLLLQLNQHTEALKHYKIAAQLEPLNQTASHMAQALSQNPNSTETPPDFVRALFDQYAYSYDFHVKNTLQYQAPHLIRENLTPYIHQITTPWIVLDMGCGTGLCAPYLQDIAGKLIGVDISENMIAIAKNNGGYDKLIVENIEEYLPKQINTFDLIVAADVLCYFGELEKIFDLIRSALIKNGLFAFTVEKLDTSINIHKLYQLQPSGRFAHSGLYIQENLIKIGCTIEKETEVIIRFQENKPVLGYLYIARAIKI